MPSFFIVILEIFCKGEFAAYTLERAFFCGLKMGKGSKNRKNRLTFTQFSRFLFRFEPSILRINMKRIAIKRKCQMWAHNMNNQNGAREESISEQRTRWRFFSLGLDSSLLSRLISGWISLGKLLLFRRREMGPCRLKKPPRLRMPRNPRRAGGLISKFSGS